MSNYKSQAMARELADVLTKEVAATMPVVVQTFDSNNNPVITLSADSTPATGEKVVVIRIQATERSYAKDILGNTAFDYGTNVIQICTEANYAGATDNVADILTPFELLPVLFECSRRNSVIEWYVSPNGTVPSTAAMTAGNLGATQRSLYWGNQTAQ